MPLVSVFKSTSSYTSTTQSSSESMSFYNSATSDTSYTSSEEQSDELEFEQVRRKSAAIKASNGVTVIVTRRSNLIPNNWKDD